MTDIATPPLAAQGVPDGWLPLLVRAQDYGPVTAFIAAREAQRQAQSSDHAPVPTEGATEGEIGVLPPAEFDPELKLVTWPVDQLRQLADSTYLTAQRWTHAMDVVAPHRGRLVSSEIIAALTGMPINDWRDAARKLTAHLKAHYSVPGWPLLAVGGRHLGLDDQVYWGISTEQAELWREVRSGGAGGEL